MPVVITHTTTPVHITIRFDGYIHAMILRDNITWLHSYIQGVAGGQDRYFVEIQYTRSRMVLEYDSKEKWCKVLEILGKELGKQVAKEAISEWERKIKEWVKQHPLPNE